MNNEQFEILVNRLERQAQENPGRYKFKVLLLATLGNAYIGAMLLLVVALLVALVASITVLKVLALKLIVLVGFFLWMIVRALWVRIDPPVGTEIKKIEAPELFALVDGLRRQLGTPRFHHVLITDVFNAGVVQSPRLGIFGWTQNYLLIGLPLMKTLTVDQFKAVLAHEFGHLAKDHGRMSNWIYRQRLRWSRLLTTLDASSSRGSLLFTPFLNWFTPYFNAYSFPMARANEYEADATSARLTSPRKAAEALTNIHVVGSYLEDRYWPQIHKQADEQPQPNFTPYFGIGHSVIKELDAASSEVWLDQVIAMKTDSTDTHPALNDRLEALGELPRLALPQMEQTADRLLGDMLEVITTSFDQRWRDNILSVWEEHYQTAQNGRRQLAEFNTQIAAGAELTVQDAYDRALLTETIGNNPDDALAQFHALHERAPDNAMVCFALGIRLLKRNDAGGCALIEQAMHLDENAIANGCEQLRDYHWRNENKELAHGWHQRMVDRLQLQEAATKERNQVSLNDKFERHGLPDEALAPLRDALRNIHGLRKAYLVKKRVKHLPHSPCYILAFRTTRWFQPHSKQRRQKVLQQIKESVPFPGETIIISVEGDNYRFGHKFRWIRGARIL